MARMLAVARAIARIKWRTLEWRRMEWQICIEVGVADTDGDDG